MISVEYSSGDIKNIAFDSKRDFNVPPSTGHQVIK